MMPTFNRQNPSLLKDLFQETINKTTKNMAYIDYFHDDEMRCMLLLQVVLTMYCITLMGVQGALNFGLCAMCHQKDPTFFCLLSPKDPHFHQLSPNDPLFLTNSMSPKDPDTSLSLKVPSFLHLIVKQLEWQFSAENWIFQKFIQIWRNV